MKFKRGNMVTENAIGLILAVAVTFVLIFLMISLFSPTFNKGKEGAESYFDSLEDAIVEADKYGASSFFMLDMEDEGMEFYLVYFGEAISFAEKDKDRSKAWLLTEEDRVFVRSYGDESLCICYWQGENVLCNDCMNLDGLVNMVGGVAPWVVREGEHVKIKKNGGDYVFSRD